MPSNLDNPAGRLHALLSKFRELADSQKTLSSTWAEVLGVDHADLPQAMCEVAAVLVDVKRTVEEVDLPQITEVSNQYYNSWAESVLLRNSPTNQTPSSGGTAVDQNALLGLSMVSTLLSLNFTQSKVPDSEEVASLRMQLQDAIDSVRADTSLPNDVQVAILTRLSDMVWSLDRLHLGGADAVRAATERLLGTLVLVKANPNTSQTFGKVAKVLRFAWSIFTKSPQALEALESWQGMMAALPPGPTS